MRANHAARWDPFASARVRHFAEEDQCESFSGGVAAQPGGRLRTPGLSHSSPGRTQRNTLYRLGRINAPWTTGRKLFFIENTIFVACMIGWTHLPLHRPQGLCALAAAIFVILCSCSSMQCCDRHISSR